jgi:general secretion pathway protein D
MKPTRLTLLTCHSALLFLAAPARGQPHPDPLSRLESGPDYQPRSDDSLVAFSLEDADLPELVRVIGQLTGKRFIFGGKVHGIKATIFSPQKVTVAEAYQAFLSILDANGLTVIPHGRFYKIVEAPDARSVTPVYVAGQASTGDERYVTRLHRLQHGNADEMAAVLGHLKSKDGDIVVYGPGNLLIITDTGSNIQRMVRVLEDMDVGGVGNQVWIEPIHYGAAADVATRLAEVFDIRPGASGAGKDKGASATPAIGATVPVTKIVADDRSNSLVIVATEPGYLRVLELIKRLDLPSGGDAGEIHVVMLQHADATDLSKSLNEIISGASAGAAGRAGPGATGGSGALEILESKVKVSADKATNSIIVTASIRDFARLRTVVDTLDMPRRQVFIEAVIMDMTIDRENQLGVSYHLAGTADQSVLYGGLNPFRTILLPSSTDTTLNAFALGIRGPGVSGTENLLGTGISLPAFGVLINALASTNDSDTLATPHILATDNVAAEINVGQNIPLQTNSGSSSTSVSALGGITTSGTTAPRQDIGTKIKIVPHLNDSDEVRLEVSEEISDVAGQQAQGSLGAIPFAKRTATTQLVVKDQQTVVIGGLMRNHLARTDTKIPLLGDIPVLGALFRSSSSSMTKTNLLLILTPYIIRDQGDLRTIFERKMQERQEFLDHYFVFSDDNDYSPPKDTARENGLLEEIRKSYAERDEKERLDELSRPPPMKTHEPGQPLPSPPSLRPDDGP